MSFSPLVLPSAEDLVEGGIKPHVAQFVEIMDAQGPDDPATHAAGFLGIAEHVQDARHGLFRGVAAAQARQGVGGLDAGVGLFVGILDALQQGLIRRLRLLADAPQGQGRVLRTSPSLSLRTLIRSGTACLAAAPMLRMPTAACRRSSRLPC